MTLATHQVTSEIAYDLMHEHLDTILALLQGPLPEAQVVEQLGSRRTLERLVRHGLVTGDGGELRAVASVYHQMRQEGMLSFLEHYVLPDLTAGIDGDGLAEVQTCYLRLTPAAMTALRGGRVQRLFDALTRISDQPARGALARATTMVFGTSRVSAEPLEPGEQALTHLRHAASQRATPAERDLAVLSQYVFLADHDRLLLARSAIADFVASFASESASSNQEANYHLTVASHWRLRVAAESEVVQ